MKKRWTFLLKGVYNEKPAHLLASAGFSSSARVMVHNLEGDIPSDVVHIGLHLLCFRLGWLTEMM
jgi:hypothetical protein